MGFYKGTMITAVASGTTSRLTGGKFANGAVTGAFVHMFNNMADDIAFNRDGTHNDPVVEENIKRTKQELRQGVVTTLKATSAVSGPASIAAASTGQVYASFGFMVVGYFSDYALYSMGELNYQTITNNVIIDSSMILLQERFPIAGGLTNTATKVLVNN